MTDNEVRFLFKLLKAGGVLEPAGGITNDTVNMYLLSFQQLGLTQEDLARGVNHYLQNAQDNFWPMVGKFLHDSGLKANAKDAAELAWLQLQEIIRTHGRYPSITINDAALVEAVFLCGGYQMFCDTPDEEMNYHKASFRAAYEKFRHMDPTCLRNSFTGLSENTNQLRGLPTHDQGVYIGYTPQEQEQLLLEDAPAVEGEDPLREVKKLRGKAQLSALVAEARKRDASNNKKAPVRKEPLKIADPAAYNYVVDKVAESKEARKKAREELELLRQSNPLIGMDPEEIRQMDPSFGDNQTPNFRTGG